MVLLPFPEEEEDDDDDDPTLPIDETADVALFIRSMCI
jgi:hypothetical protein